jgi:hypothetical protein
MRGMKHVSGSNLTRKLLGILCISFLIAACGNGPKGIRFTNDSSGAPEAEPIRQLSAAEIQTAIVGKTFQYTRADGNGFVNYNADGTFTFQDDTKGEGTGKWTAGDGQFCEVFGAKAVQECGEFKTTGDAYFAAKSRLVEMKI